MTATSTPLSFAWGSLPDNDDQYEATAATSDELRAVLARIHAEALIRGLAQQVDAWPAGSSIDPDDALPDPFIQFLLGDPHRASLRWLGDEASSQATDPDLAPLPGPIRYDRGDTADDMEPADTRITPATVEHILDVYVQTGSRPQDITWIPL